ncbi:MAG TPA: hypothetical protein VEH27_14925 [Methylomirabilota bacterium]|nr:hypothetical protein [Methylomirabilota bacterium]
MNASNEDSRSELIEFVLAQAAEQPVCKRARLYRQLATLCDEPTEKQSLLRLSETLETAEARCREFTFNFAHRHA